MNVSVCRGCLCFFPGYLVRNSEKDKIDISIRNLGYVFGYIRRCLRLFLKWVMLATIQMTPNVCMCGGHDKAGK